MAKNQSQPEHPPYPYAETEPEEEEEEETQGWDDWMEDEEDGNGEASDISVLCLFCNSWHASCHEMFEHCRGSHWFDFRGLRVELGLDFYGCFKLINYIRSQVVQNRCWICGLAFESNQELLKHSHEMDNFQGLKHLWDDDKYLQPFMADDSLLYSFDEDEEGEKDHTLPVHEEKFVLCLGSDNVKLEDVNDRPMICSGSSASNVNIGLGSNGDMTSDGIELGEHVDLSNGKQREHTKSSILNLATNDIKKVNEDYFGSYSSFSIHREMLSDKVLICPCQQGVFECIGQLYFECFLCCKPCHVLFLKVRMDAYREAILGNSSLMRDAVVMDVGCGTGILSLFAAKAGASRVIAVEASEKMAAVATQIARDNKNYGQVMEVVNCMVEDLDKVAHIKAQSVDVLLSEWMGYCLLYESMLSSVLFARDRWLKPGGAILPDTATMYVAGFGKSGTSLQFWEDVHGFNMSFVGKELVQDAAKFPIVDVVDGCDLVTHAVVLKTFDLTTMKPDEVDFTSSIELEPKLEGIESSSTQLTSTKTWCYGVVLWFDTGFTRRFCKETPAVLSTSPYGSKTHWSQTIFTFREPIAMVAGELSIDKSASIGTDACPAARIHLRISIARAAQHRSIDISLETTGICYDGRKCAWPVQMFNLM